jgi:hypothetical protein
MKTFDLIFFGTLTMAIAGAFAAVAVGVGDHSLGARIGAGVIGAGTLAVLGRWVWRRYRR